MHESPTLPALADRKKVLRMVSYGVYVMTARHEARVAAATVDWVTQASFAPPLLVTCLRADSFIHALVTASKRYALHFLAEDQKELAATFFKHRSADERQINGRPHRPGVTDVPILEDAPAWAEAEVVEAVQRGDHTIFVGQVVAVHLHREARGLALRDTGWHYGG